jgi:hypothetical protein
VNSDERASGLLSLSLDAAGLLLLSIDATGAGGRRLGRRSENDVSRAVDHSEKTIPPQRGRDQHRCLMY